MSGVTSKLVNYHVARLQDKDASVRLKAIRELELLGHPDALEPLQRLYLNEPDLEVRKAAQAAGRTIFANQYRKP
jgi:HEAT repeat protein